LTKKNISEFDYKNFFKKLDLYKYDNILINSSILEFLIYERKNKKIFNISNFINELIESLNPKATLFIPAYNWDFCNGKIFDKNSTEPKTGSLAKSILKRTDFFRTQNPLYSFFVYGKNASKLANIDEDNCFNFNSVFGYLIKKKAVNIFLGLDYKKAFTFVHVAEQKAKVNYRYLKSIKGKVLINGKIKNKKVKFFVRNLAMKIISTEIDSKLDKYLIYKNILYKKKIMSINIQKLKIDKTYEIILRDLLKKNFKYVYPKKKLN